MKQIISLLLCLALVLPMVPARALAWEPAAEPLSNLDNTRVIDTAEEFMAIMDDPDGSYRLEADLDLGEVLPLGYDPETGDITHFTGSLDGNGCTLTYSIRNLPADAEKSYADHYGLFASMLNAEVFSLNLNADLELVLDETSEFFAGLLTGRSHGTTFAGIRVDGSISVEQTAVSNAPWSGYVGGLVGSAEQFSNEAFVYTVVTACDLDLDVRLQSAGASLSYSGVMDVTTDWAGQVYYTNLTGSVEAYGSGITIKLLDNCEYSTCSQNMDLTATGDIKAVGSEHGIGNAVSGVYTVNGASAEASVNLTALEFCDDSCFYGSMTATGTAEWLALLGASMGERVQVECPMTVHMPDSDVNIRGIERCNDSSFTGDFDMTGGHVHSSAMENCNRSISYCNMYCEAGGCNLYPLANCYDCYGEGRVEGNCRTGIVSLSAAWGMPISGDRNYYAGDMFMYSDRDEARITGISGNENMLEGDLVTKTNGRSVIQVISGDNNFYAGNVSRTSHGGDMEHGITLEEKCMVFDGTNSYFKGTVECMFDFHMGGTSCYMDGAVTVTEYGLTMDLTGENNYFTGSADLYYAGGTVGLYSSAMTALCYGDFPITVHHNLGGVFNTADLGDRMVYYHAPDCSEQKHIGYPTYAYDVDNSSADYSCYHLAVSVDRPNNSGTAASTVEGWTNAFDPEEKVVRPEREPATYTLQAVNANGDGVGNVLFHLEEQVYEADENGMVEISGGPGAIAPLVITAPSGDGEDTILRRINTFYPVPDRLNQIRVSEALELEFSMGGKDAPSGSQGRTGGFKFDLFGHEVQVFALPMEVDLEMGEDVCKISIKYNQETGLYDAVLGTVAQKGELPDKKEVLEALMKKTFPSAVICPPKKMKMFGAEWKLEALGCLSFAWDGVSNNFTVHDSKVMLKLSGEARLSGQLPPPLTMLYATGALSGETTATVGVEITPEAVAKSALMQVFATVEPTIRLEGAIGAGTRHADFYAEIGLGGQLDGSMDLPLEDVHEDLSLTGSVDIFGEAKALVFGGRISKKLVEVKLWPVEDNAATALLTAEDMQILPRTYAASALPGADAALSAVGAQAQQFASVPGDEENDYPYMDVQLWALSGDRYLLLYTDDDLTRESADRSTLRAVIGTLTDGTLVWGESVPLEPDGTADLIFDVCVSNDRAAVVWQDLNTTFGDGDDADFETVASAVELNTVVLDCTGDVPLVGEITTVSTGTDVYEYMPRIWYEDYSEKTRISWVTSTVNDPLYDGDETYTLWLSDNGSVTAMADTQSPIMAIGLAESELFWSEETEEGGSLWQMDSEGTITQLLESGVGNLQSRGDYLCYTVDGTLYLRTDSYQASWETMNVDFEEFASVRLTSDGRIWAGVAGLEESVIYILEGGVLRPVFRREGFLSSWDAADSCVAALMKTGFEEDDTARLVSGLRQELEAVTLGEIECSNPMATPGSTMYLHIPVRNDGTASFGMVDVQVLAQDGTALYSNSQWSASADAGETVTVNLQFTLPEDFPPQTLTVSINGATQTIAVGGSNLAVEGEWDIYDADSVSIFLYNTGSVTDTGRLTLRQDGQTVWTEEATVAAGGMEAFLVPLGKYYDTPADMTVTLEESAAGLYTEDNEDTVYIRPDYARSLVVTVPALTEGEQGLVGVRVWPEGSLMPGVTYASADPAVATIGDDGVITAVAAGETEITVTTHQGRSFTATLTVAAAHVHSFTNYISDNNATCTADGTKTAVCDSCQVTDTIPDEGSALGHDMGEWYIRSEASCTGDGAERRECSRCGHSESRTIPATGHSWDDGVVTREPTEETPGERCYTCLNCGATRTETIPELEHEHSYEAVVTEPTCTEQGCTTHTCSCGDSYMDSYVDALGHSWDEGVVTVEPTEERDGEIRYTCTRCGEIRTEVISLQEQEAGFYSLPVISQETCIQEFHYHQINTDQNVFYFGFHSDYWTVESVEPVLGHLGIPGHDADDVFTLEQVSDSIYKITLTPWAVSTGYSIEVGLNLYLTDPEGNSNNGEWYTGIWCHNSAFEEPEAMIRFNHQEHRFYRSVAGDTVAFTERLSGEYNDNGDEVWIYAPVDLPDGVSYDPDTNTLTLDNASLEELALSFAGDGWQNLPNADVTIALIGENTISSDRFHAVTFNDNVNVTITGNGSLALCTENSVRTDENGNYRSYATVNMYNNADLTIARNATVTVETAGEAMESCWDGETYLGIRPAQLAAIEGGMGSLTLKDNASLTTIVPEGSRVNGPKLENEEQVFWDDWYPGGCRGIRSMYTITIEGGTLNTQEIEIPSWWDENGFVGAGSFLQSGGTVNITARGSYGETEKWVWDEQAQENISVGIVDHYHYYGLANYEGGYVEISGGELNINCLQTGEELASSAWGDGIKLGNEGGMVLSGGTVNVEINCGYAVTVGDLTVSGGTLNAISHDGCGMEVWNCQLSGGTVHAEGRNELSARLYDLTIDGGTLNIRNEEGPAIYANDILVTDGLLDIQNAHGMTVDVWNSFTVEGGTVNLSGKNGDVLNLSDADAKISGGTVSVTGENCLLIGVGGWSPDDRESSSDGSLEITGGKLISNYTGNRGTALETRPLGQTTITGDALVELNGHLVTYGTMDIAQNASVRVTNGGFHVFSSGVMTLDGGEVSVSDVWEYEYENDYPIANNVDRGAALLVNGGTLTLEHDNFRVGLNLDGSFSLNGGEVTVTSTNANDNLDDQVSYAIRSQGLTAIHDGVLNLTGTIGYNQFYDGSNTDTKLTVNGGTINVSAAFMGIRFFAPGEINGGSFNIEVSGLYSPSGDYYNSMGLSVVNLGYEGVDPSLVINGGVFDVYAPRPGDNCRSAGLLADGCHMTINGGTIHTRGVWAMYGIHDEQCFVMGENMSIFSLTSADRKDLLVRFDEGSYTDGEGNVVDSSIWYASVEEDNVPGNSITGEGMDECTDLLITANTCGETTWDIDNGELIISGEGRMDDYVSGDETPWSSLRDKITSVTVEAGVTSVGDYAFSGCSALTGITFLGDAPAIGDSAFLGVTATASYDGSCSGWTSDVLRNYGGNITWVPCDPDHGKPVENPFTDVAPGSFYYDPVMWAIENGITNGTSATTFGPNDQCMRAHVVTFLWRAVGCPEPTRTDNPFVDVKPTDFYYKPVLWALENGITSGMDATHFGPTAYCNRAQVVTFLYRTMGSPALESMDNPFTDVQAGAFYEKPVLWAVQNGITNGLSATAFGPNAICNRAQIVTFLYRAFVD